MEYFVYYVNCKDSSNNRELFNNATQKKKRDFIVNTGYNTLCYMNS